MIAPACLLRLCAFNVHHGFAVWWAARQCDDVPMLSTAIDALSASEFGFGEGLLPSQLGN
jgi:hypothetical protein